jgi:ankyrin repeat protein
VKEQMHPLPRLVKSFSNGKSDPRLSDLHQAVSENNLDKVKNILSSDPLQVNSVDFYNRTPIHYVFRNLRIDKTSIEIFSELVNTPGANLNLCDKNGMNILHHASLNGSIKLVSIIIESTNKIDIDTGDILGNTSIINSTEYIFKDVSEYLIKHGANIHKKNNNGKSAFDFIKENFNDNDKEYTKEFSEQ